MWLLIWQEHMEKSIFTEEYAVLVALLRETRQTANVTQEELAKRIGQSQSFVSKMEQGEKRVDVIQLRTICQALGTSLTAFVKRFEKALERQDTGRQLD